LYRLIYAIYLVFLKISTFKNAYISSRARCISARLLEPAQAGAQNQPQRALTGFLRAAL